MYNDIEIEKSIEELKDKFSKIKKQNWIKGNYFGKWNSGITLEKLLGKNIDNFEIPDYKGIELKVINKTKSNYLNLFSAAPDGKYLFENKRIWEKYGYYENHKKIFYVNISTKKYTKIKNNFHLNLYMNPYNKKIYLCIYKNYKLIDKETHWTLDYIKEKLYRKLKYLCIIEVKRKKENNIEYYKYTNIKFYKVKDISYFIKSIQKGYIKITFEISSKKDENENEIMHNHGTTFKLLYDKRYELFKEI